MPERGASRRLWIPELVLYGIRLLAPASLGKLLLAKQFLGIVLDIDVDQSAPEDIICN